MFTAPTGTSVLIESRPLHATLYEWGNNLSNVDRIATMIAGSPA